MPEAEGVNLLPRSKEPKSRGSLLSDWLEKSRRLPKDDCEVGSEGTNLDPRAEFHRVGSSSTRDGLSLSP